MLLITATITFIYIGLIGSLIYGFNMVKQPIITTTTEKTSFSIIIPFRNEAINLPQLLGSLKELNYPHQLFEIIMVNDSSMDNSEAIILSFSNKNPSLNIKLINNERLSPSPKKDAINTAIEIADHDWIITTDADCILPINWLKRYDTSIQNHETVCIAGPVSYYGYSNFLELFQSIDFLSLQGVTIGSFGLNIPFMANGANLAYKKSTFKELGGFEGNTDIASGDDVFLLEKITSKFKKSVYYLKSRDSIVMTKPEKTWVGLIMQRKRWAAKSSNYNSFFGKFSALTVLLTNSFLVFLFVFSCFGLTQWKAFSLITISKVIVDYILIKRTAFFFNQKEILSSYLPSAILYPFFCCYVGICSLFSKYEWKGRTFQK